MSSQEILCGGCRKVIEDKFNFCPYCGTSLGFLEEKMTFERLEDLRNSLGRNIDEYEKEIKHAEGIRNIVRPEIIEEQRERTSEVLKQFPELERRIEEEPEPTFKIFIIDVPYESENGTRLHDCLLQILSCKNSGLINLSCGAEEISSDLYSLDVPIWAPSDIGDLLLNEQRNEIINNLPKSQKKFMLSAEPWAICTRVYNIEGRWVVWRIVNDLSGLDKFMKETATVPINFQFFADLRYSHLFPVLATPKEGELILGIFDENEEDKFFEMLAQLNTSYSLDSRIVPRTISISKEILEDFGVLPFSVRKFLSSQIGHLHSTTISKGILEQLRCDLASLTKKITIQTEKEGGEFREHLAEEFLEFSRKRTDGILRILRPIPREQRLEYKIPGGAL
jgi:hypothetical protein